jgi:hypothetical protein
MKRSGPSLAMRSEFVGFVRTPCDATKGQHARRQDRALRGRSGRPIFVVCRRASLTRGSSPAQGNGVREVTNSTRGGALAAVR